MNPHKESIQSAAAILSQANEAAKAVLVAQGDLYNLAHTTYNRVSEIIKGLYGIAGLPATGVVEVGNQFKPLTQIMGVQVDQREPITEQHLTPTPTEKEKLVERIHAFYAQIPGMSDEKVLEVLREPKGETILRGVAKKAGIDAWRDHELNVLFVQEIQRGIEGRAELEETLKNLDNVLGDTVTRPWSKELPESFNEQQPLGDDPNPENKTVQYNQLKPLDKTAFEKSLEKQAETHQLGAIQGADQTSQKKADDAAPAGPVNPDTEQAENPIKARAIALKAEGKTMKQIAEQLGISTGTAHNYTKDK